MERPRRFPAKYRVSNFIICRPVPLKLFSGTKWTWCLALVTPTLILLMVGIDSKKPKDWDTRSESESRPPIYFLNLQNLSHPLILPGGRSGISTASMIVLSSRASKQAVVRITESNLSNFHFQDGFSAPSEMGKVWTTLQQQQQYHEESFDIRWRFSSSFTWFHC